MLVKKWLAVIFAVLVSVVVLPCCPKAEAAESQSLADPSVVDTIVPKNMTLDEVFAYGENNHFAFDDVELIGGTDYWEFKKTAALPAELWLVTKAQFMGAISKTGLPTAKVKIKNFITTPKKENLDLYLTINVEKFITTGRGEGLYQTFSLCPFKVGISSKTSSLWNVSYNGMISDDNFAYTYSLLDTTVCNTNYDVQLCYSSTNNPYKTEKSAAYYFSDVDQLTGWFDESGNRHMEYLEPNDPYFCNEGFEWKSGAKSMIKSKDCKLNFAKNNTLVYPGADIDPPDEGNDCYDRAGVVVVTDASHFNFTMHSSECGTSRMLETANNKSGIKIHKTSSDENFSNTMKGAVYGVYSDSNCVTKVKEITLDENGEGQSDDEVFDMKNAKYYVKEMNTPTGYKLDTTVHEVDLSDKLGQWCELNVTDDPLEYTLKTSVEHGTISEGATINYGDYKQVTYEADEGYHIKSVTVDGEEVDIKKYPDSYTFENITADHEISVVYEIDKFVIKTYVENGTITDSATVEWGGSKLVKYAPEEGYHLASVTVDDVELDEEAPSDSHEFDDVVSDHEVKVVYAIDKKVEAKEEVDKEDTDTEEVAAASTPTKTETKTEDTQSETPKKASLPSTGDECSWIIIATVIAALVACYNSLLLKIKLSRRK